MSICFFPRCTSTGSWTRKQSHDSNLCMIREVWWWSILDPASNNAAWPQFCLVSVDQKYLNIFFKLYRGWIFEVLWATRFQYKHLTLSRQEKVHIFFVKITVLVRTSLPKQLGYIWLMGHRQLTSSRDFLWEQNDSDCYNHLSSFICEPPDTFSVSQVLLFWHNTWSVKYWNID